MRPKMIALLGIVVLTAAVAMVTAGGPVGAGGVVAPPMTIHKVVVGTDPGIAFPVTLTCDSQGSNQSEPLRANIEVPNDGSDSIVIPMTNGQTVVHPVGLPQFEPDLITCRVTEDLTGVTLPDGITCTGSVSPESHVVYDITEEREIREGEFTVTNTCTAAVEAVVAQATTIG